jgi:hypothetical protein
MYKILNEEQEQGFIVNLVEDSDSDLENSHDDEDE